MADFYTHITTSTVLGVGYSTAGMVYFQDETGSTPLASCLLVGGMCSVSGMLPDIDSDTGRPLRESMAFAAAVLPMMLIYRLEHLGLSPQSIVLIGVLLYLFIRFPVAAFIRKRTVHRGMFHSIPAAIIAAQIGFLLSFSPDLLIRYYAAGGVFLGFMSHLVLDEIWSVDWQRGRLKKSFGTATKLWGSSLYANLSTYAKVAVLGVMVFSDPIVMERYGTPEQIAASDARRERRENYHRVAFEKLNNLFH